MRAARGSRCPQKSNGIARPTALGMKPSGSIRGAMQRPLRPLGNFDFNDWNPTPVNAFPAGQSVRRTRYGGQWLGVDVHCVLGVSLASSLSRSTVATRLIFRWQALRLKGGSPRTAACMLRPTFRNWFQAHYHVYAGFRCVNH